MTFVIVVEQDYGDSSVDGLYQLDGGVTEGEWGEFYNQHRKDLDEFKHALALEMFPVLVGLLPYQYSVNQDCEDYWNQVYSRPSAIEEFKRQKKMWKVEAVVINY